MPSVILQGSSRSDGNTRQIVDVLAPLLGADIINLKDLEIHHYDYKHRHQNDEFLPLIRRLVQDYDTFIFATPVYWYSMSGIMKVFFDRLSDCLQIEKDTGRKLRGKRMAAVCCGSEPMPTTAFFTPFQLSADYLGMTYLGDLHTWIEDGLETSVELSLKEFAKRIKTS